MVDIATGLPMRWCGQTRNRRDRPKLGRIRHPVLRTFDLVKAIGQPETFWLYALFGGFAVIFFAWRVPETKDRSLEQIEREIHSGPQRPSRERGRRPHSAQGVA